MDKNELAWYVERFQSGDISAFEVIYNETNNQVYNLLYSYTKSEHTSFDLMQETYLTVNNKIGTIKDPYAIKSWINRITINKANRFFEKNKREVLLSEEGKELFETQLEIDEEFLPQDILDSKEKQKIIKEIIDNLPVEQKTAVYLYYFDELSLSEVAADMECSEGTVKSRLNYARKKIKAEVDTWERKGTKLYGTGVPILLLLLTNQLGIESIPLDKANAVLKDMLNSISGKNVINTVHEVVKTNHKLIHNTSKTARKVFGIKAVTIIVITSIVVASLVFINKPFKSAISSESNTSPVNSASFENTADFESNNTAPKAKKEDVFISYGELHMENGISSIKVLGDDIVTVNDDSKDKCIQVLKKDSVESGKTEVKVTGINGNEKNINAEIYENVLDVGVVTDGDVYTYTAYKEITEEMIVGISNYDDSIVEIKNDEENRQLKFKGLREGETTANLVDSQGVKNKAKIVVKEENGKFDIESLDFNEYK